MHVVFLKKVHVNYQKHPSGDTYSFYLNNDKEVPYWNAATVIEDFCQGKLCKKRERAECAYILHQLGYLYASYTDFAQEFSLVCERCGIQNSDLDNGCFSSMSASDVFFGLEVFLAAR